MTTTLTHTHTHQHTCNIHIHTYMLQTIKCRRLAMREKVDGRSCQPHEEASVRLVYPPNECGLWAWALLCMFFSYCCCYCYCCCCCLSCVFGASSFCIHEYVIEFCGVLSILFFPPAFQLFFFHISLQLYLLLLSMLLRFFYDFVAHLPSHPLNFNIFAYTLYSDLRENGIFSILAEGC